MWVPKNLVSCFFPLVLIPTPWPGYSGGVGPAEAGPPCGRATPPAMEELLGGYVVRSAEIVPSGDGVELWRLHDGWIYVLASR